MNKTDYHRRILAVTFTNKASGEMKSRIVSKLYEMAKHKDEKFIGEISKITKIPEHDIPDMAAKALTSLLHDYSHFSVVTIDSFFQKVIRSFAREMGLYTGYDIELDQQTALDEATNLMLNDIDNNDFLKDWMVEWAKRKIEEGKSWNPKWDVMHLGSEIFSEELQNIDSDMLRETTDKERLKIFRTKMQTLVDNYSDYLQDCGKLAVSIMDEHGLAVDSFLKKKDGVGAFFSNIAQGKNANINSYIVKALDSLDGWYKKDSTDKKAIVEAYNGGLNQMLQYIIDYQNEHARETSTAVAILKQINVLGVLCDLMDYVKKYSRDQNLFLISEASGFIKKIIANADAPFIYERVGSFYNHFMIDEFQDTSLIQWENFLPLISNSIASGHNNWIVGDVKQSIYRWRNTDWKILAEKVESDIKTGNEDEKTRPVVVEKLDYNRRSALEIIQFNNAFFREAVLQMRLAFLSVEEETADTEYLHKLTVEMTEAYRDSEQRLPEGINHEKGYVYLEMLAEEKNEEETWREIVKKQLPKRLEQLQDLGYRLSQIAILVRENKEAQEISDMLLAYRQAHPESKYRYDALSNESLLINNSPVVKWLVAAMHHIIEPDDAINNAFLFSKMQGFNLENTDFLKLKTIPVYELSDLLINQFDLYQNTGQAPFLQAFQDILLQYIRREASDIRSFLDWWKKNKERKCVAMPENQDAIRLATIHKSKGLEFDVVIIPFCDWQLCKSGKTLWRQPDEEPFNDMKLLPLQFDAALSKTIFVNDYLNEKMLSYIDNLNLLYVAFTRAKKALFISMPQQKKESFVSVKNLMHRVFNMPLSTTPPDNDEKKYINLNNFWHPEKMRFELGENRSRHCRLDSQSPLFTENIYGNNPEKHKSLRPHHFGLDRQSAIFSEDTDLHRYDERQKGLILHDIFRKMLTIDDLERFLNPQFIEGNIAEAERENIVEMVKRALSNPTVSRWFSSDVSVKTEAEILLPNGSIARPDRIVFDGKEVHVIDYKFGKLQYEKDSRQALQYMNHLRNMGYKSVKGFIWYVMQNQIKTVGEEKLPYCDGLLFYVPETTR